MRWNKKIIKRMETDSNENSPRIAVGTSAPENCVYFTCMLKSFDIVSVSMSFLDHDDIKRLQKFM